ncbi:hypothetical protein OROMI_027004 [Orobanche minor]
MDSIPADALIDDEMVDARDLKRRSLTTSSDLAKPAEKRAKLIPQSLMCEEMETSESKAFGATSEELVPIEMPKEYKKMRYIDRVSGDSLLVGPPQGRKMYTFLDGNFLVVECKLIGRRVLLDMLNSALLNRPYEGSEREGKTVIDLIDLNDVLSCSPPPEKPLIKYLNQYMDLLIKLLEEEKVKEMPDRAKIIDFLVSHREDIDFFMGPNTRLRNLEGSVVCAYYKNGRSVAPILMYFNHGLAVVEY